MHERTGGPTRRLCAPSGRHLIQLRHPGTHCDSIVIEDGPAQVVVQYICQGRGYGRTRLRRETTGWSRSKARASPTGCRLTSRLKPAGSGTALAGSAIALAAANG